MIFKFYLCIFGEVKLLSIILVNYNNSHHTINCLKSLQNQNFKKFELIIVDNNSGDLYKRRLQSFLKTNNLNEFFKNKIKVIYSDKNMGFTGGNNLGIKNSRGNLILLLNCDTFHEPTFLESMVDLFKKYKFIHIAQPKICYYHNKNIIWQNGGKINKFSYSLFKPIDRMKKDEDSLKKPFKIDFAVGCALFIRMEILKKIGLLDNVYFMYGEDSDLCYRATLKGYMNIYCNPKTKIYHNIRVELSNSFKKFYFQNRMIFCFKYFSIPLVIWQFFMQFIQIFIYTINFRKKKINYNFFFKGIKGTINGIKLGFKKRLEINF